MGRKSTVNDASVYAAVGRQLSENGTMTLHDVVAETGVSVGSLYHRYGSREGLLAQTWLDAVRAFQSGFLIAIKSGDDNAGERAALATPQFCRAEPGRAVVLACCRRTEFIFDEMPHALQAEIYTINEQTRVSIRRFAKRTGYSWRACQLALIAFPLGAVRLYLPTRPVPHAIDAYIVEAYRSVIRLEMDQPMT